MVAKNTKKESQGIIRVKQIKSVARCTKEQVSCVKGLGLRRIGDVSELQANPCVLGMIRSVSHLVKKCDGE